MEHRSVKLGLIALASIAFAGFIGGCNSESTAPTADDKAFQADQMAAAAAGKSHSKPTAGMKAMPPEAAAGMKKKPAPDDAAGK